MTRARAVGAAAAVLVVALVGLAAAATEQDLEEARTAVDLHVREVQALIASNCSSTSLDTVCGYLLRTYAQTARFPIYNTTAINDCANCTDQEQGLVFVTTGLSPDAQYGDMWLRDGAAQMHYYVASGVAAKSAGMQAVIAGAVRNQARMLLMESYANSFLRYPFESPDRRMRRGGFVGTGNYEAGSPAYTLWLAHALWEATGSSKGLDWAFKLAAEKALVQWVLEQAHNYSTYTYVCVDCPGPDPILPDGGKGSPIQPNVGLTWTGFRPSDDPATYGYHAPDNAFVSVVADRIADLLETAFHDRNLASIARTLAADIRAGMAALAPVVDPPQDATYAYELDGLGNQTVMDDANVPSLLSLPYLGWAANDSLTAASRRMALSSRNPLYITGSCGAGVGSAHPGTEGNIWPMGLIMEAMTSVPRPDGSDPELARLLRTILETDCGTGYMHESFDPNDGCDYTREYFGWPNAMFAEMVEAMLRQGRLTPAVLNQKRVQCGGA